MSQSPEAAVRLVDRPTIARLVGHLGLQPPGERPAAQELDAARVGQRKKKCSDA
jgi:hypothetical protein